MEIDAVKALPISPFVPLSECASLFDSPPPAPPLRPPLLNFVSFFLCVIHIIGALLNNVCSMNVEIINNSRHGGEILLTETTKRELCELV